VSKHAIKFCQLGVRIVGTLLSGDCAQKGIK